MTTEDRFPRIENKIDKLSDSIGELKVKVASIEQVVSDIKDKTIAHDNYTEKIDERVSAIEEWIRFAPKVKVIAVWLVTVAAAAKLMYDFYINR